MAPVNETCPASAHLINKLGGETEEQDKVTRRTPLCENVTSNGQTKCKPNADFQETESVFCSPKCNKENCLNSTKFHHPKLSTSVIDYKPYTSLSYLIDEGPAQPATPEKKWDSRECHEAPLTPTANLKMLSSAVSPELRRRDLLLEEESNRHLLSQCDCSQPESPHGLLKENNFIQDTDSGKLFTTGSRKEKSLGLLCQKFLAKYPNYPDQNAGIDISLDEVARDLSVGRRRIYDIVNVLESVEIVSRVAKNKYAWHGKTNLCTTLAKLKALAEQEGFREQMNRLKEYELKKELVDNSRSYSSTNDLDNFSESDQDISNLSNIPKFLEKSLGIMSQKFLMLFLVLKPKTVNLDLAAKILIGNMTVDKTENSKFKTKIRRLYDIANILTSLGLIRKIHVTEIRGRKPAFKYIGPEVDSSTDISTCSTDGCHRPSSRHSLLDCVKNQKIANILNNKPGKSGHLGDSPLTSQDDLFCHGAITSKKSFSRHSSFDSICEVAEKERTKLFSQPSTPLKESKAEWCQSIQQRKESNAQHIIFVQKGNEIHGYHVLPNANHSASVSKSVNASCSDGSAASTAISEVSIPIPGNTAASTGASKILQSSSAPAAPKMLSPRVECSHSLIKHSTNNNLTAKQMEAVLKSLKDPIPVASNLPTSLVDASTQSSPSADQSEKHAVSENLKPTETSLPGEPLLKKRRVQENYKDNDETADLQKSPSGSSESSKRQSPNRALHLEPEFQAAKYFDSDCPIVIPDDDLAIPLIPVHESEDKSSKAVLPAATATTAAAVSTTPKGGCGCNCCMNKHSMCNVQPTTPKLMHISNQTSSVVQLPLLAVASVTASPAGATNSFAYANTDMTPTLASISARAVKVHQLSSPHIVMPLTFTSSPVSNIAITDNPQSSPTLVAFPVSQPTMTLAPVQLVQSTSNNSNSHLKTPTPITLPNQVTTPNSQIFFQSPCTLFDDLTTFATPNSFFRNTPNPNLETSSSHSNLMSDLKRLKPQLLTQDKPQVCTSSAARRLNLIESP
ncbi:transcription factor E2F8 [Octopus bimaculoides]|uniref:E2F/DP family winged-helix DNA-binding domain-containing protein n=1 Tax=Octopus bimaculoides TaxID=37653 RepID=A0A0L8I2H2_OCTBM|nr:transcription factor E2F8 [Octopus bimaculoides]XP_052831375.1 transcription factor E2F8 [Octopus bimaculoides]|eukprot:XP_014791409.1 PREDICTED: transcription factor E2F8-like [Octopus bimaculoides]